MATAAGPEVALIANVADFRAQMTSAARTFNDAMRQMRGGYGDLDTATKSSERAHGSFLDKLREFKGEQVQQGRMARFYAGELASIIPAAEGGKTMLQSFLGVLVEGAAGGLSFGLAFEVVKTSIEFVTHAWAEAKRMAKEAHDQFEESLHGWSNLITTSLDAIQAAEDRAALLKPSQILQRKADTAKEVVAKVTADLAKAEADAARPREGESVNAWIARRKVFNETELKERQEQVRKVTAAAAAVQKDAETTRSAEQVEGSRELGTKLLEIQDRYASDEVKVRNRALIEKRELETKYLNDQPGLEEARKAIDKAADQEIYRLRQERAREHAAFMLSQRTLFMSQEAVIQAEAENQIAELKAKALKEGTKYLQSEVDAVRAAAAEKIRLYHDEEEAKLRAYDLAILKESAKTQADENVRLFENLDRLNALREKGWDVTKANAYLSSVNEEWKLTKEIQELRTKGLITADEEAAAQAKVKEQFALTRQMAALPSGVTSGIDTLTSSWQQGMQSMLAGTYNFRNLARNIWQSMVGAFSQRVSMMVAEWMKGQMMKVAATSWGAVQRIAITAWEVTQSAALAVWEGLKWVAIQAYKAAASAYAAVSAIPFVGPFLAPAAAAAVLAGVIALGASIASAAEGYDIPKSVSSQLVLAHGGEKILPRKQSEGLDNLIENGGGGGITIHYAPRVQALDARGVDKVLQKHQGALVRTIDNARRNGRRG